MTRRSLGLLVALVLAILVPLRSADAQPLTTVPRIGFVTGGGDLDSRPLGIDAMPRGFPKAFRQGLRELGYIEQTLS
jgi:hypothetical protein